MCLKLNERALHLSIPQTSMMDEKEMYNQTRSNILAMMDVAMGGRAAEEVIYGMDKVTTGKPIRQGLTFLP